MPSKRGLIATTLTLGLAVLASCGGSTHSTSSSAPLATSAASKHELLAPAAAEALLQDPPSGLVVLDVRTPAEFAAGHISGAIDLDLSGATFQADVSKLDPGTPYFVYCHSGNRSAQAVAFMQQHGFRSIYELQGGITAWQSAGMTVVTS
jgi:rhodanese-related sulfurtransferase